LEVTYLEVKEKMRITFKKKKKRLKKIFDKINILKLLARFKNKFTKIYRKNRMKRSTSLPETSISPYLNHFFFNSLKNSFQLILYPLKDCVRASK